MKHESSAIFERLTRGEATSEEYVAAVKRETQWALERNGLRVPRERREPDVGWQYFTVYTALVLGVGTLALTLALWEMFDGTHGWPTAVRVGFYAGRGLLWLAIGCSLLMSIGRWVKRHRAAATSRKEPRTVRSRKGPS